MKKILLGCILLLSFTGCFENIKNKVNKTGGLFIKEPANYIIVNTTGNRILDVYKLEETYVSENTNTDGLNFRLKNGTHVTLQGDVKVLRNPTKELWNKYEEYHYDEDFKNIEKLNK